ncbi:MAG TPA: flagellar hook-basal body complex protein FliE [Stellaceae bacterium]|nr:flagellar hook-basal body complex protein FliE [Stellaceae bacterium]
MPDPVTNAITAYSNAGKIGAAPGLAPREDGGGGFGDLLRQAADNVIGSLKQGEQTSFAGVVGKADIAQVAAAVANAETTLETVVAVRDRVIQAYQDIIKMAI